jgi:hypothetical protein
MLNFLLKYSPKCLIHLILKCKIRQKLERAMERICKSYRYILGPFHSDISIEIILFRISFYSPKAEHEALCTDFSFIKT